MASIERIDKIKKRTKSLKMKTTSLTDNVPKIGSSSFDAIEVRGSLLAMVLVTSQLLMTKYRT